MKIEIFYIEEKPILTKLLELAFFLKECGKNDMR